MRTLTCFPAPPLRSYDWQQQGLCRGMSSEHFFTDDRDRSQQRRGRTREVKELCARCPVADLCLQHALEVPETHGIWGGTTAAERAALALRDVG